MVTRWVFLDLQTTESYTVPLNPRTMGSLFRERRLTIHGTSAVNGQDLVFEGRAQPQQWEFSGAILDEDHYAALYEWVYEHVQRIQITDHHGRDIVCQLQSFDLTPKRAINRPWRSEYTIRALVFSVTPVTS